MCIRDSRNRSTTIRFVSPSFKMPTDTITDRVNVDLVRNLSQDVFSLRSCDDDNTDGCHIVEAELVI